MYRQTDLKMHRQTIRPPPHHFIALQLKLEQHLLLTPFCSIKKTRGIFLNMFDPKICKVNNLPDCIKVHNKFVDNKRLQNKRHGSNNISLLKIYRLEHRRRVEICISLLSSISYSPVVNVIKIFFIRNCPC